MLGGTATTHDLAKLPQLSADSGNLVFSFVRDQASISGTTRVVIEVGSDLATWPDSHTVPGTAVANNPGVTVVKDSPLPGKDTVTLTLARHSSGRAIHPPQSDALRRPLIQERNVRERCQCPEPPSPTPVAACMNRPCRTESMPMPTTRHRVPGFDDRSRWDR